MALAKQSVLHVACGFWHTACVARPKQPGQEEPPGGNYLSGSVDASAEGSLEGETRDDMIPVISQTWDSTVPDRQCTDQILLAYTDVHS